MWDNREVMALADLVPVGRSLVADAAVEQIKTLIVEGRLGRGDRLPPELQLAAQLGVGRNTVREALRTLEAQGWVRRTRRGTRVLASESDLLLRPLENLARLQRLSVTELFEARRVLEGELAALAAQRATPEEVEEIGREAARLAGPDLDDPSYIRANVAFHMAVARAAHNRLLLVILEGVRHLLLETQRVGWPVPEMRQSAIAAHAAIARAIAARDGAAARALMHRHLHEIERGLTAHMASMAPERAGKGAPH